MSHQTMTEQEAKTKWCPFTRGDITANERTDTTQPDQIGKNAARCIAAACMAWRWTGSHAANRNPTGYCGLAGTA